MLILLVARKFDNFGLPIMLIILVAKIALPKGSNGYGASTTNGSKVLGENIEGYSCSINGMQITN